MVPKIYVDRRRKTYVIGDGFETAFAAAGPELSCPRRSGLDHLTKEVPKNGWWIYDETTGHFQFDPTVQIETGTIHPDNERVEHRHENKRDQSRLPAILSYMIGDDEESESDDTDNDEEDNEDPDYIPDPEDIDEEKKPPLEGRRIVDMQFVSSLLNDYKKMSSHRCVTIEKNVY